MTITEAAKVLKRIQGTLSSCGIIAYDEERIYALEIGIRALEQLGEEMTHHTSRSPAKDINVPTTQYADQGAPFDEPQEGAQT